MRRFPPVFVLLLMLFFQVSGQQTPVVLEALINSIAPGPVYDLEVLKIRNGSLTTKSLSVTLAPGREDLMPGLRRFRPQKWLLTLQSVADGDAYVIQSAYGLGQDSQEGAKPFPIPLTITPDELEKVSHSSQHGRATFGVYEQEIVERTNIERWNNGMLAPYKQVTLLHNAADGHSEAMALQDFFAHCNLTTGSSPGQRMTAAGYIWNAAAENIAAGYSTPQAAMTGWMNSSGHRANILNTSRREIGVGYEYSNDTRLDRFDNDGNCVQDASGGPYYNYWTQNFGTRSSVYPVVIEREMAETSNQTVDLYIYGPSNSVSMRFSNNGSTWSDWVSYTPDYSWQLSTGGGLKTVYSQVSTGSNGGGTIYSSSDVIEFSSDCDPMLFNNETLSGTQTYTACEIIADPNVMIDGLIIFQAGTVTLGENVEIPMGATFDVEIQ